MARRFEPRVPCRAAGESRSDCISASKGQVVRIESRVLSLAMRSRSHICIHVRVFRGIVSIGKNRGEPYRQNRMPCVGAQGSALPIVVLLAAVTGMLAGCSPRVRGDAATADAVRKYEDWLQGQSRQLNSSTAMPKPSEEIVFVTCDSSPSAGSLRFISRAFLRASTTSTAAKRTVLSWRRSRMASRRSWCRSEDGATSTNLAYGRSRRSFARPIVLTME